MGDASAACMAALSAGMERKIDNRGLRCNGTENLGQPSNRLVWSGIVVLSRSNRQEDSNPRCQDRCRSQGVPKGFATSVSSLVINRHYVRCQLTQTPHPWVRTNAQSQSQSKRPLAAALTHPILVRDAGSNDAAVIMSARRRLSVGHIDGNDREQIRRRDRTPGAFIDARRQA